MVRSDHRQDVRLLHNVSEQTLTEGGVASHRLPFQLVEGSRLREDPIGNRKLPHIVKESSQLDTAALGRREVQLLRDGQGQAADRGSVLAGVSLLELEPVDEPGEPEIGPSVPGVLELTQLGDDGIHRWATPFGG